MLVFGSMLFYSLAVWERELSEAGRADPGDIPWALGQLVDAIGTAWSWFLEALALFLFGDLWFALELSAVIQTLQTLYQSWLAVVPVLVLTALAIVALDRLLDDRVDVRDIVSLRVAVGWLAIVVSATVGVGILAGAVLPPVADVVPRVPRVAGEGLALLLAAVTLLGLAQWRLRMGVDRLRVAVRDVAGHGASASRTARALLGVSMVVRAGAAVFSVVVVLIVLVYAVRVLVEGRALGIIQLLLAAPWQTKVLLGFIAIGLVVLLVLRAPDDAAEAARLWTLALGQKAVSALLFVTVGPLLVGIVFGGAMAVLGSPLWLAAGLGAAVFAIIRGGVVAAQRVRNKGWHYVQQREDPTPTRAFLAGYTIDDADGRPIYVVRIDARTTLAHRDADQLVATVTELLVDYFQDGEFETTVAEHYWARAHDGLVDLEQTKAALRGETRDAIELQLREHQGSLSRGALEEQLEQQSVGYVDDIVEDAIGYLRRRGRVDLRQSGEVLVLSARPRSTE